MKFFFLSAREIFSFPLNPIAHYILSSLSLQQSITTKYLFYFWQREQKKVLLPPRRILLIFWPHRGQDWPCWP